MDRLRPPQSRDGVRQPADGGADKAATQEQEWARQYLSRRAAILRDAGVTRVSWQHAMRAGLERASAGDIEGLEASYRATVDFHRYLDRQVARLHQTVVPSHFESAHRDLIEEVRRLRRVLQSYEQAFRPGFFRQYGHPDERRLQEGDRMLTMALAEQQQLGVAQIEEHLDREPGDADPSPD